MSTEHRKKSSKKKKRKRCFEAETKREKNTARRDNKEDIQKDTSNAKKMHWTRQRFIKRTYSEALTQD